MSESQGSTEDGIDAGSAMDPGLEDCPFQEWEQKDSWLQELPDFDAVVGDIPQPPSSPSIFLLGTGWQGENDLGALQMVLCPPADKGYDETSCSVQTFFCYLAAELKNGPHTFSMMGMPDELVEVMRFASVPYADPPMTSNTFCMKLRDAFQTLSQDRIMTVGQVTGIASSESTVSRRFVGAYDKNLWPMEGARLQEELSSVIGGPHPPVFFLVFGWALPACLSPGFRHLYQLRREDSSETLWLETVRHKDEDSLSSSTAAFCAAVDTAVIFISLNEFTDYPPAVTFVPYFPEPPAEVPDVTAFPEE